MKDGISPFYETVFCCIIPHFKSRSNAYREMIFYQYLHEVVGFFSNRFSSYVQQLSPLVYRVLNDFIFMFWILLFEGSYTLSDTSYVRFDS